MSYGYVTDFGGSTFEDVKSYSSIEVRVKGVHWLALTAHNGSWARNADLLRRLVLPGPGSFVSPL